MIDNTHGSIVQRECQTIAIGGGGYNLAGSRDGSSSYARPEPSRGGWTDGGVVNYPLNRPGQRPQKVRPGNYKIGPWKVPSKWSYVGSWIDYLKEVA
jgi:hypothetical protein